MSSIHPTLKTYEEFIAYYEKDSPGARQELYKNYQFAVKERQRLRNKDKKYREKKKEEKAKLPPVPPKKKGRPRKIQTEPSLSSSPQMITSEV